MALSSSSSRQRLLYYSRFFRTTTSSTPTPESPSPPSTTSVSSVISKLRSEYNPSKIISLYSSISSLPISSISASYALDLAVKRLAKSKAFSDIETLIEGQKKHPKVTHEPFLSHLILCYGQAKMIDHAIKTFNQMDDLGTPRTSKSFNALLTACNKSGNFGQVQKLFAEIPDRFGVSRDKFSYGMLVKSLCETDSPEVALKVFDEMKGKNIEITSVTYTTVLDALYKKGKVDEAEKIWNEMSKNGISPDVASYNVRIMHAHRGKPEEVLKLIDEMTAKELKPDTISYNYLLKCYFENGKIEDAMKVYESLKENGCQPNAATFRTVVHYLCKNEDFDMALKVAKASYKGNKIPDPGTMTRLVEGLVKNSKLEEATGVIEDVKKRFPENFLNVWKKLEKDLGL